MNFLIFRDFFGFFLNFYELKMNVSGFFEFFEFKINFSNLKSIL